MHSIDIDPTIYLKLEKKNLNISRASRNSQGPLLPYSRSAIFWDSILIFTFSAQMAVSMMMDVELTPEGYIKRDSWHRTNIPGVYSAGDVEGGYKQIVTAAGQGLEAALAIFEDLVNPYWKSKKMAQWRGYLPR